MKKAKGTNGGKRGEGQGLTGRVFQLRVGYGLGIGKFISGRFGYGLGTGICIEYLINRVLSGSENLDRVFFGYLTTSYLSHGTWWFLVGPYGVDGCLWSKMIKSWTNLFYIQTA